MSLTPFTGTTSVTTLRSNFDDKTTTLATNALAGEKDQCVPLVIGGSLVAATALSLRSIAFTLVDTMEVRTFFARGSADAGARVLTLTITTDNGDTQFVSDQTLTVAVTSAGAGVHDTRTGTTADTANAHGDYRNATPSTTAVAARVRLERGVRYRMTLTASAAGTWTDAFAVLQLRTIRRIK